MMRAFLAVSFQPDHFGLPLAGSAPPKSFSYSETGLRQEVVVRRETGKAGGGVHQSSAPPGFTPSCSHVATSAHKPVLSEKLG